MKMIIIQFMKITTFSFQIIPTHESTTGFPTNWMYAHSYVVNQRMNQIYTPEVGLKMGTIFPELVSPYCPNQSLEEINYLKRTNQIGGGCNS